MDKIFFIGIDIPRPVIDIGTLYGPLINIAPINCPLLLEQINIPLATVSASHIKRLMSDSTGPIQHLIINLDIFQIQRKILRVMGT